MSTTIEYINDIGHQIKRRLILILVLCAAVFMGSYVYNKSFKPKYETYSKIFPLSINSTTGSGSLEALKAQFGMSEKSDLDKIYNVTELVNSKNVSLKVVLQPSPNKKYKRIADWIIDEYNTKLPMFGKKMNVTPKDSVDYYFTARDIMLGQISVASEKTEFYTITTSAYSKELAQVLNEAILNQLSVLYIHMTTEKPRSDLNKIKFMRDSLNDELTNIERRIAGYRDANQMAAKMSVQVPQRQLERQRTEIEEMYANTATAYQNARFKLLSESPIFQILDKPGEPFQTKIEPAKKNAAIHAILAFFLLCFVFSSGVWMKMIKAELSKV